MARTASNASSRSPPRNSLQQYVASGEYWWNSGMFVVRASVWLAAIALCSPDMHGAARRRSRAARTTATDAASGARGVRRVPVRFDRLRGDGAHRAPTRVSPGVVVPLVAGWSDVGAWDAVWEASDKDARRQRRAWPRDVRRLDRQLRAFRRPAGRLRRRDRRGGGRDRRRGAGRRSRSACRTCKCDRQPPEGESTARKPMSIARSSGRGASTIRSIAASAFR